MAPVDAYFSAIAIIAFTAMISTVYLWYSRNETARQLNSVRQHCYRLVHEVDQLRATNQKFDNQLTEHQTR